MVSMRSSFEARAFPLVVKEFVESVKAGAEVETVSLTLKIIDENYNYFKVPYQNGKLSCRGGESPDLEKILSLALLADMDDESTYRLFGEMYRNFSPESNNNQNLKNFIQYGLSGVKFTAGCSLVSKLEDPSVRPPGADLPGPADQAAVAPSLEQISNSVKDLFSNTFKGTIMEGIARRMSGREVDKMATYWNVKPSASPPPVIKAVDTPLTEAAVEEDDAEIHPVYGKLLIDLGYKKTYVTSVRQLLLAKVWNKQRILRPDRALVIADAKIKAGTEALLPGVITFFLDQATGETGIVDGQHRSAALVFLSQKGAWDESRRNVLVDVFVTKNDDEISNLFSEINAAEPVRLVDMPGMADEELKSWLDVATSALEDKYDAMFKPSVLCKPPHLNIDVFRDDLFQSNYIKRSGVKSGQELLAKLEEVNAQLCALRDEDWARWRDGEPIKAASAFRLRTKSKQFDSAQKKARLNKFFLGLVDKSWMFADADE